VNGGGALTGGREGGGKLCSFPTKERGPNTIPGKKKAPEVGNMLLPKREIYELAAGPGGKRKRLPLKGKRCLLMEKVVKIF